ncbi:uncharacterized protein LOC111591755 [Ceratitis capitata]|uniref:uncharacterized protein LOC111591755 n=1 Tax=Ceratitis capitata TaxID=7213 RepID=UPI000C6C827E|nr:uncharacterized protein LOC111591755 [Ceratitis capitata]
MIWRSNVDWDELVTPKVAADWLTYRRELQLLSKLKISRWLGMCSSADEEFHVFTDASEAAYTAAIYCRTKTDKDEVKVVLIAAKTRVAPLKTTSLPRLELCAAHLGARLVRQIQTSFGHKLENLYAWTDSMITLAWLQGMPSRWSVFVANRVADVQEVLPASKWRHVVSELNPADCASRGINPSQLITHPLWWTGPNWLRKTDRFWCKPSVQHNTDLEQKPGKTTSHVTHTVDELSKPIPMRSSLVRLQPFLDAEGILRVGGRIKNASCSNDIRNPMILPKRSSLARLIAAELHITMLHAGPQMIQAAMQRRFWVPGNTGGESRRMKIGAN